MREIGRNMTTITDNISAIETNILKLQEFVKELSDKQMLNAGRHVS
jgi:hypothetical protein